MHYQPKKTYAFGKRYNVQLVQLKLYYGTMPRNPFEQTKVDAIGGSGKQAPDNHAELVLPVSNHQTSSSGKQAADKHEYGENRDTDIVLLVNWNPSGELIK